MDDLNLLRDDKIMQYLLKNQDIVKSNYDVPSNESPSHYIIRMSNELHLNQKLENDSSSKTKCYSLPSIFASKRIFCVVCKRDLTVKKCIQCMLYDDVLGSYKIAIITKYCTHCKYTYYPGYFESWINKERHYYPDWSTYGIFVSTNYSAFSIDLLDRLICMKQKCHTTFIGKAAAYNLQHMYHSSDEVLDKRRLTEGYFKYTFILFKERYNLPLDIINGIDASLKEQFSTLYDMFQNKYGNHICDTPGCEDCLVIDGNMKAHRKYVEFLDVQKTLYSSLCFAMTIKKRKIALLWVVYKN